jgi:hypothetical protein
VADGDHVHHAEVAQQDVNVNGLPVMLADPETGEARLDDRLAGRCDRLARLRQAATQQRRHDQAGQPAPARDASMIDHVQLPPIDAGAMISRT